jgi:hypothetical protein
MRWKKNEEDRSPQIRVSFLAYRVQGKEGLGGKQ